MLQRNIKQLLLVTTVIYAPMVSKMVIRKQLTFKGLLLSWKFLFQVTFICTKLN